MLTVTDPVIHGEGLDLNCTVTPSAQTENIYWYIVDKFQDVQIYTLAFNGTGFIGDHHDYLVGRDARVTKESDALYTLHIEQADRNKDIATYKCKKATETLSDKKEITHIYSKL